MPSCTRRSILPMEYNLCIMRMCTVQGNGVAAGAIAMVWALLTVGGAVAQGDVQAVFDEGYAAYGRGQYQEAAGLFARCHQAAPDVVDYLVWQATALIRAEAYRDALPVLNAVLERSPDNARARANLGLVWHRLGSPQTAISELRTALQLDSGCDAIRRNLAELLMERGALDEAEALWRERLAAGNDSAEARQGLALVLERQGQYGAALAEAEAALTLRPDSADLVALSARLYLHTGDERTGMARMASIPHPTVPQVEPFAAALLSRGAVADAVAYLEQPGIREGLTSAGLATLAEGLRQQERWEDLQPVLVELVSGEAFAYRWWPQDRAPVLALLAWLAQRSGEPEAARQWAERALAVDPAQPTALRIIHGPTRDMDELTRLEADLVAGQQDLAAARYVVHRGVREADYRPTPDLIAALAAWVPEEGRLLRDLGILALRIGEHEHAVTLLQRAAQVVPDDAVVRNNLGVAYELAGRNEEALEEYSAALRIQPDQEQARANLERLRGGRDG